MTKQSSQPTGQLVMYGLGEDRRPHAARFSSSDEPAVLKAAGLMGLAIARADSEALKALAKQLPAGRIFATGRALVPFVRQAVYDQLVSQGKPLAGSAATKPVAAANAAAPSSAAAAKTVANGTNAKTALQTTVLVGITADERAKLLSLWPAKDRKVPDFCNRLASLWDAVWLPAIRTSFAERARAFTYADFEKLELDLFAPTIFKCWQHRWLWGVCAINGRWQLWTGFLSSADNRSVALLFDITSTGDDRHPELTAASIGDQWQPKTTRYYTTLLTKSHAVPARLDVETNELKQLVTLAQAAISTAAKLLKPAINTSPKA
jgi:hypothetical protein